MKQIGIWLDKDKAHIVEIKDDADKFKTVLSNLEHFRIHGGSGTRIKGGPQDVVQDSRYLEREKHQLKNYFNNIITHVKDAETIAIFGPADTRIKFKKEIEKNHKELNTKIAFVKKADSMTENQLKAMIKSYFN